MQQTAGELTLTAAPEARSGQGGRDRAGLPALRDVVKREDGIARLTLEPLPELLIKDLQRR